MDIHGHWLRQEVQAKRINLRWTPTADMPADGLTKVLTKQKNNAFLKQLNLIDTTSTITPNRQLDADGEAAESTVAESVDSGGVWGHTTPLVSYVMPRPHWIFSMEIRQHLQ